jgi:predicted DCC family thiol-disulfide oxidoreductase YuxK
MSALIIAYLTSFRAGYGISGAEQSLYLGSCLVLLFGLFRHEQDISIDTFRRTAETSLNDQQSHLQDHNGEHTVEPTVLQWTLLTIVVLYAGSAWGKAIDGPLFSWLASESLARYFVLWEVRGPGLPLADVFFANPWLFTVGTWGTILLEAGFLIVVLASLPIWPVVISLIGMHTVIAATMGPLFFDQMILFFLFFNWSAVYGRIGHSDSLDIVYDEHCFFCVRSLYVFPFLDTNGTVTFYTQYTAPEDYKNRSGVDFEEAMFAFRDGQAYRGYWAFRELLRQFSVFAPLVWLMGLSPIAAVGERVYQYIADNRDRHFTCAVDGVEEM